VIFSDVLTICHVNCVAIKLYLLFFFFTAQPIGLYENLEALHQDFANVKKFRESEVIGIKPLIVEFIY
jgi:hypothetical protein